MVTVLKVARQRSHWVEVAWHVQTDKPSFMDTPQLDQELLGSQAARHAAVPQRG